MNLALVAGIAPSCIARLGGRDNDEDVKIHSGLHLDGVRTDHSSHRNMVLFWRWVMAIEFQSKHTWPRPEPRRKCPCCGDVLEYNEDGPECDLCQQARKREEMLVKKLYTLYDYTEKYQKEYLKLKSKRWVPKIRL
jgi:hypothetical protein